MGGGGAKGGRAPKGGRGKLVRNFDKASKSRIIYLFIYILFYFFWRRGGGTVGAEGRGPNFDQNSK